MDGMVRALDLSAGQYVKGLAVRDTEFSAVSNFSQLQNFVRDPILLQPTARRGIWDTEDLEEESAMHALVQRVLAGQKKRNVPAYANYIEGVVTGRRPGVLPSIHLMSTEHLETVQGPDGQAYLLIPNGSHLLPIDGETQMTAHYQVHRTISPEVRKRHATFPLKAVIHHGITVEDGRQYFHDLNVYAIRVNVGVGLGMDTVDPLMRVVAAVERDVPFFTGRVDKQARQLPKKSASVVTLGALRQMVINVAKGISGIQYGSRPFETADLDLDDLTAVATDWIGAYVALFAAEVADRERSLAGSAPVLAAVGAIGHQLLEAEPARRQDLMRARLSSLESVRWSKGEQWSGIAGKYTSHGAFAIGGTKEVAYAIFNALTDTNGVAYARVRPARAA
jgi:DNA sulfur modification protein DndB